MGDISCPSCLELVDVISFSCVIWLTQSPDILVHFLKDTVLLLTCGDNITNKLKFRFFHWHFNHYPLESWPNQIKDWKENNPVFGHVAALIFCWRVCCVLKRDQGIQFCVYQINQGLKSVTAQLPRTHLSQQSFEINWNVSFPPANWHDRLVIIKHHLCNVSPAFLSWVIEYPLNTIVALLLNWNLMRKLYKWSSHVSNSQWGIQHRHTLLYLCA